MTVHLVVFDPNQAFDAFSQIRGRQHARRLGSPPERGHVGLCTEPLRRWYREMSVVFPSSQDASGSSLPEDGLCAIDRLADYAFFGLSIDMDVVDTVGLVAERQAMAIANRVGVAVMNLSTSFPRCFWPV